MNEIKRCAICDSHFRGESCGTCDQRAYDAAEAYLERQRELADGHERF